MKIPIQIDSIFSNVSYPWQRLSQIYVLSELSDKNYYKEKWESCFWDNAWASFITLYCDCDDDISFYKNFIGCTLADEKEAAIMAKINTLINPIIDEIGEYKEASAYLTSPLWDELVACAKEALEIFLKNEEEAKKTCVYPWHLGEDPDDWAKKKAEKMKELEASKNQSS